MPGPTELPTILEREVTYRCGHTETAFGLSETELDHYTHMGTLFTCTGCYFERMWRKKELDEKRELDEKANEI